VAETSDRATKSFKAFRLDTTSYLLWRNREPLPVAPKSFDVLAYLVKHAGQEFVVGDYVPSNLGLDSLVVGFDRARISYMLPA
jgi:hypothetical protein